MKRIFSALLFLGLALTAGESPGKALALADNDRLLFITYADCENLEADEGSVRAYASLRLDPETLETFPALESLEGRTTVSRLSGLPAIVITPRDGGSIVLVDPRFVEQMPGDDWRALVRSRAAGVDATAAIHVGAFSYRAETFPTPLTLPQFTDHLEAEGENGDPIAVSPAHMEQIASFTCFLGGPGAVSCSCDGGWFGPIGWQGCDVVCSPNHYACCHCGTPLVAPRCQCRRNGSGGGSPIPPHPPGGGGGGGGGGLPDLPDPEDPPPGEDENY